MKTKLINRFYLLLTAVVLVCLASCSSKPKHARLISKDAFAVVQVNVKQIVEKAQAGDDKKVADKLKKEVEKMDVSAEAKAKLLKIVEDPAEAGVDLRKPVLFFFEDPEKSSGGMVAALHDADKFTELLNSVAKDVAKEGENASVKEVDGLFVLPLAENKEVGIVYDNDMVLILGGNDMDMVAEAQRRFKDEKAEGVLARADFDELCSAKGDAQVLVWGGLLDKVKDSDLDKLKALLPSNVKGEDLSLLYDLNTDKGEVTLAMQVVAVTDEAKSLLEEKAKSVGKIDGELLDYVSEAGLMAFAANLKGEEIAKQVMPLLKKEGQLSSEQERLAETFLKNLDGDCLLALRDFKGDSNDACLLAKVKDERAVKEVVKALGGPMLEEVEPGQYSFMGEFYVGVKDGTFYLSTPSPVLSMAKPRKAAEADEFKGKLFFGSIHIPALMNNEMVKQALMSGYSDVPIDALMANCDRFEVSVTSADRCELRLKMKDDSKNPLELITSAL